MTISNLTTVMNFAPFKGPHPEVRGWHALVGHISFVITSYDREACYRVTVAHHDLAGHRTELLGEAASFEAAKRVCQAYLSKHTQMRV